VLLPWKVADHLQEYYSAKLVTKSDKFFDIPMYVPHLASLKPGWSKCLQARWVHHPQIFLGSMLKPVDLVKKMSTQLKETQQEMWLRQLPQAKFIICLGWLLFLAPEYNLCTLQQAIGHTTGADVALNSAQSTVTWCMQHQLLLSEQSMWK